MHWCHITDRSPSLAYPISSSMTCTSVGAHEHVFSSVACELSLGNQLLRGGVEVWCYSACRALKKWKGKGRLGNVTDKNRENFRGRSSRIKER